VPNPDETLPEPVSQKADVLGDTELAAESATHGPADGVRPIATGTQIGRLVVLGQLGSGGTAVLYVAYDRELDRKVALKFMQPALLSREKLTAASARLVREAQALARLNHPNVVTVHDVGTYGDQVFIAEALVDGWTVTDWVKERHRSVREILGIFIQAGRGLAAAHAAGLVHRDFKPDNVLIDRDGRAHVGDFGLARASGEASPGDDAVDTLGATRSGNAGILASPLTRTGAVMGTPAYMAPEQHLGLPTDPRTDQFNFCAALYEMLYGELPFGGKTVGELACEVTQGRIRPPPEQSRVPAWLRRILVRGLKADRKERYESMGALLDALGHDPAVVHRRVAVAVGLAAALVAVAFGAARYSQRGVRLCSGAERKLAGIWDASRKEAIRSAFLATKKRYAYAAYLGAERALDGYTRAWVAMHEEACLATRSRGEQSEALLDLRMRCLDQRLDEVKALTDLFAGADAKVVERAVQATGSLSTLSFCADAELLKTMLPLPKDAATLARVHDARAHLARVKALHEGGQYDQALALAGDALKEAQALAYRPLEAEALWLVASLELTKGNAKRAEQTLKQALWAAMAGRHREIEVDVSNQLIYVVGYEQKRVEEGHFWAHHAEAALAGFGRNDALAASWHSSLGVLYGVEGKQEQQLEHGEQALALALKAYGPEHGRVAVALSNLGVTYGNRGEARKSIEYLERARAAWEKLSGPDHPDVTFARMNLADAYGDVGEFAKQREYAEQAVAGFEASVGPEHPYVGFSLRIVGEGLHNLGDHARALASFRRAQAIREKALGPKDPETGQVMASVARELHCLDEHSRDTLDLARRAVGIVEKALGRDNPQLGEPLAVLGAVQLDLGAALEALPALERALPLTLKSGAPPDDIADIRFTLARALWQTGRDRARAITLATQARDDLRKVTYRPKELGRVEAFLRANVQR
jgi:eukaryotic-like serine/threonine-protein kinase